MKRLLLAITSLFASCSSYSNTEQELLAATLVLEAGGEGAAGMQAVACVVVNRSIRAGEPVGIVLLKPRQFATSAFKDPVKTAKSRWCTNVWGTAMAVSSCALGHTLLDTTNGATHFHAATCRPEWAKSLTQTKKIGNHVFYRETPKKPAR